MKYLEANTLEQLARKVEASGGQPVGPPVAKIVRNTGEYTTVTWWVQGVAEVVP